MRVSRTDPSCAEIVLRENKLFAFIHLATYLLTFLLIETEPHAAQASQNYSKFWDKNGLLTLVPLSLRCWDDRHAFLLPDLQKCFFMEVLKMFPF